MTDQPRPYRMELRAASQERTRQRITESAVELHGTLGPARTSMSAVAAHAGVRRSTLYRHFPDEAALFDACTAHWAAANRPPDLEHWASIADTQERLVLALQELYGYYRRTERMLENLFRDERTVPIVAERFAALRGYFDLARDTLLSGRGDQGEVEQQMRAALGHAVAFSTWRSLVGEQGLEDAQAVELMCAFVSTAAQPPVDAAPIVAASMTKR